MGNAAAQTSSEEMERALSKQRHDFLNHLQVVYAYVQIGKTDKALRYMDTLAETMKLEALERKMRGEQSMSN